MLVKPTWLVDRELEWTALARFVERKQRLAVLYGPRRVGKSFLLEALCEAAGGFRYQAIAGVPATQLHDFGRALGDRLGVGELRIDGWADALHRLSRLEEPFVAIDELPYLTEAASELPSLLQRYVDSGEGPPLILSGSALSVMAELVEGRSPLYGRAGAIVVPAPLAGPDLSALWNTSDPQSALWIDAALGGLPGYRPLVPAPGAEPEGWMVEEVLAPSSPLLDAAEASLVEVPEPPALRGTYRAILNAIAQGERSFSAIARVAGFASGALSRPLAALHRAGLVERIPDPLRARRDRYELADPHLRLWLSVIAPNRSGLQAGRAAEVWESVTTTTWRAQVLGPRWEEVVRAHFATSDEAIIGPADAIGTTTVSDRTRKRSQEVDLIATRAGKVHAIGESKLRALGLGDLQRLRRISDLLGATEAKLVLASASGFEPELYSEIKGAADVIAIGPAEVYG